MDAVLYITDEFVAVQSRKEGRIAKRSFKGLTASGHPIAENADVLADIYKSLGLKSPNVGIVLPARVLRTRRIRVDVPVDGVVRSSHLAAARAEVENAVQTAGRARLYFHPAGYSLDGNPGSGDPVGQHAQLASIDTLVICTDISVLSSFERIALAAGSSLVDAIVPYLSTASAVLGPAHSGVILHIGSGEAMLFEIRNHFIRGAASVSIGLRHFVQDIVCAAEIGESEAAGQLRAILKRHTIPSNSPVQQAVDARLEELGEWMSRTISANRMEGPIILNGHLSATERLSSCLDGEVLIPSPLEAKGPLAPLLGAPAVLDGTFGVHSPAEFAGRSSQLSRGYLLQWLKTHF